MRGDRPHRLVDRARKGSLPACAIDRFLLRFENPQFCLPCMRGIDPVYFPFAILLIRLPRMRGIDHIVPYAP